MKNIVLIDGENFVHGILASLRLTKTISRRSQLTKISIGSLFDKQFKYSEILYYTTRIKMPDKDHKLFDSANRMRLWNGRWLPYIANQNTKLVRAGQLKVRDGKKCKSCGKSNQILLEKGVDVRIAVDIVSADCNILLFSSDSDLIPAVQSAVKKGKKVTYIYIEGQKNMALSKVASESKEIKNKQVLRAYSKVNQKKDSNA